MTGTDIRRGTQYILIATLLFAAQDGFSRHLAGSYNTWMVVMLRYWFFAGVVTALAAPRFQTVRTAHPALQALRGMLLAGQICVMVLSYTLIGLVQSYAVFASYPLFVALLAPVLLGERGQAAGWLATAAGFAGVLIVLAPGSGVFRPEALLPLAGAVMNAVYVVATRHVSRRDGTGTSFFWTGVFGALIVTPAGLWHWQAMAPGDWALMLCLCVTGSASHWFLIKAFAAAPPTAIQPLAYLQLVWISALGVFLFNETLGHGQLLGGGLIVAAGIVTLRRA